jgi:hypothetical protein
MIWDDNFGIRARTRGSAATHRGRTRPATTRGHTTVRALDQEAAVGLEQRPTPSRNRQCGCDERDRRGRRLNKGSVEFYWRRLRSPDPAGSRPRDECALFRSKRRGGGSRGSVARHSTIPRDLAVAANASVALDQFYRLHPHESGAKNGDQKPCNAFHAARGQIIIGGFGAIVIPQCCFSASARYSGSVVL